MPQLVKGAAFVRHRYQEQDIADKYESSRFNTLLGRLIHIQEVEAINQALSFFRPSSLLEVATGSGRISKDIKPIITATGLDASPPMLKLARQNVPDTRWSFVCGDGMNLPFPDKSFDTLITFHFVRHLTATERALLYCEFFRVLMDGSILIIDALNVQQGIIARSLDKVYRLARWSITGGKEVYDVKYTKSALQQELAKAGFAIISTCGVARLYSIHFLVNLPFDLVRYIKQKYLKSEVGSLFYTARNKFLSMALRLEQTQDYERGYLWVITCVKK